jgi:hypothetical protein
MFWSIYFCEENEELSFFAAQVIKKKINVGQNHGLGVFEK